MERSVKRLERLVTVLIGTIVVLGIIIVLII